MSGRFAIAPDGEVVELVNAHKITSPDTVRYSICRLCYCDHHCGDAGGLSKFVEVIGVSCNEIDDGVWRKANEEA